MQTYYLPPSQPKIWRKIPKIGGVSTLETLTFRMYAIGVQEALHPHHLPGSAEAGDGGGVRADRDQL